MEARDTYGKAFLQSMNLWRISDGARATQPTNPYQELDLTMWLKGSQPGELADGPRNPLLRPASQPP